MTKNPSSNEEQLANLGDALIELIESRSENDIAEIIQQQAAETGVEPAAEDTRLRQLLLDVVARVKES